LERETRNCLINIPKRGETGNGENRTKPHAHTQKNPKKKKKQTKKKNKQIVFNVAGRIIRATWNLLCLRT